MGGSNFVVRGAVPDFASDLLSEAAINYSTLSGTVVAAVAGKRIYVFGMHVQCAGACAITIQDLGANSTVSQTGAMTFTTGVPLTLPYQEYPWYTVQSGNALIFTGSGATAQVSGRIIYMQG